MFMELCKKKGARKILENVMLVYFAEQAMVSSQSSNVHLMFTINV